MLKTKVHFCWVTQSNFSQKPQFTSRPYCQHPVCLISCLPRIHIWSEWQPGKTKHLWWASSKGNTAAWLTRALKYWCLVLFMALIREKREKMGHSGSCRPNSFSECLFVHLCVWTAYCQHVLCERTMWLWTCLYVYREHVVVVSGGHMRVYGKKWEWDVSVLQDG